MWYYQNTALSMAVDVLWWLTAISCTCPPPPSSSDTVPVFRESGAGLGGGISLHFEGDRCLITRVLTLLSPPPHQAQIISGLFVGLYHGWGCFSLLTWLIKHRLQWTERAHHCFLCRLKLQTVLGKDFSNSVSLYQKTSQQHFITNVCSSCLLNPQEEILSVLPVAWVQGLRLVVQAVTLLAVRSLMPSALIEPTACNVAKCCCHLPHEQDYWWLWGPSARAPAPITERRAAC